LSLAVSPLRLAMLNSEVVILGDEKIFLDREYHGLAVEV
jgi:hypothetical protein